MAEILFIFILLIVLNAFIKTILNPHHRKSASFFSLYKSNYMQEKERYEKTGRVSNWYQKGRTPYDFEIGKSEDKGQRNDINIINFIEDLKNLLLRLRKGKTQRKPGWYLLRR